VATTRLQAFGDGLFGVLQGESVCATPRPEEPLCRPPCCQVQLYFAFHCCSTATCSCTQRETLSALFNPKASVSIQKRYPYTGNLNSESPGDSKNAFLHWGDVLADVHKPKHEQHVSSSWFAALLHSSQLLHCYLALHTTRDHFHPKTSLFLQKRPSYSRNLDLNSETLGDGKTCFYIGEMS